MLFVSDATVSATATTLALGSDDAAVIGSYVADGGILEIILHDSSDNIIMRSAVFNKSTGRLNHMKAVTDFNAGFFLYQIKGFIPAVSIDDGSAVSVLKLQSTADDKYTFIVNTSKR